MPGFCQMSRPLFALCLCVASVVASTNAQEMWISSGGLSDTIHTRSIEIVADPIRGSTISHLNDVEAGAIYAGKKTEVVFLRSITANLATNNTRQLLSGVAGLNIWESDAAGVQLGIGGRGLSPNRSSNFTVRQNGYDISADPLGYPESYYTPPAEALDKVEVVRGAGSLRYGTQFGGMVNFVFRDVTPGTPLEADASLSGGSFGFASAFARVAAKVQDFSITSFYQGKRSDGWRPNSEFTMHTAYVATKYSVAENLSLKADYTLMRYDAHQPGGLTDAMFAANPAQSVRARNWFRVNWNLFSLTADYIIDHRTSLRTTVFGNLSARDAVGDLSRISMADLGTERTVITGEFNNIGMESTVTSDVQIGQETSTFVTGVRLFSGTTTQLQGNGSAKSDADFTFLNPDNLEGSSYIFPNKNAAVFVESLFKINPYFSITPGARLEYISTKAEGWYRSTLKDFAGNVVNDTRVTENKINQRAVGLLGLGIQYTVAPSLSIYANISQNYRSITFSDLRINNPNLKIDPTIHDERGFTIDAGIRGSAMDALQINGSVFYLRYNDKIGEILRVEDSVLFVPIRYRTNVSDAYTAGVELVADLALTKAAGLPTSLPDIHVLVNATMMDGKYVNTQNSSIMDKKVELVPSYIVRSTLRATYKGFAASLMMSAVGQQFTDATNATFTANAVNGIIPAYRVLDLTLKYSHSWWGVDASINNLLNSSYYTRRADSYPGPGIIPAEPLSVFITLRGRF